MGRIVTPKYRVEARGNFSRMGFAHTASAWRGRVSVERLEQWRKEMNRSFNRGGSNYHISLSDGFIHAISYARIVRQSDGEVMAETHAPMFEVA